MNKLRLLIILSALFGALSCGPSAQGRYPSYENTIAKYAPTGKLEGMRLTDPNLIPPSRYCDCPRVWYYDHWVYYHMGHWIYWHSGYWYYYPAFYYYYYDGYPYVHRGPVRVITSRPRTSRQQHNLRIEQRDRQNPPPKRDYDSKGAPERRITKPASPRR